MTSPGHVRATELRKIVLGDQDLAIEDRAMDGDIQRLLTAHRDGSLSLGAIDWA